MLLANLAVFLPKDATDVEILVMGSTNTPENAFCERIYPYRVIKHIRPF